MARAFITGVNGFIGSHLAEELLEKGYEVIGMVRPSSDTRSQMKLFRKYPSRIRLVLGDVRDRESLEGGFADADYVFHLAAVLLGTRESDFNDTNATGTCNVLEAALKRHRQRPLLRVVVASSIAAAGPSPTEEPITEDRLPEPISWYGESKLRAEEFADWHIAEGLPVTIVRPVLVHGVGDRDFSGGIFPWIALGVSPRIGRKRKRLSMISVDDVVDGMIEAATSTKAVGETYFLSDPEPYGDIDVADELANAMNIKKWRRFRFPVPHAIVWLNGCRAELIHIFTGRRPTMTRDKAREFSQRFWTVTPEKAKKDFDWESKTTLSQGLQIAVTDWMARRVKPPATLEPRRDRVLKTIPLALAIGIVIEGLAEIGDWWTFTPWWVVLVIVILGFGGVLGGVSLLTAAKPKFVQFLAGGILGFVGELANALWLERWSFSQEFIGWLPQNDWIISLAVGLPLGFVPVIINCIVGGLYRRNCRLGFGPVEEGV